MEGRARHIAWLALAAAACSASPRQPAPAAEPAGWYAIRRARLPGGTPADVEVRDGRIVAIGEVSADAPAIDAVGMYLAPAFIDSHVHLELVGSMDGLRRGGVVAAVDLASTESFLSQPPARVIGSGPMITVPGGYPLASWGRGGFGLPCPPDELECGAAAVHKLKLEGARVIKVPVMAGDGWTGDGLTVIVREAHDVGLKVAVHALGDAEAREAARAGADVLAHAPIEPLSPDTLDAWSRRAVITTLSAFDGARAAGNLRALRERDVVTLYGTDLGNTQVPGISGDELAFMVAAGMTGAEILDAGTRLPALYWGFSGLGELAPGAEASFLLLAADPHDDPLTLAAPAGVFVAGERVR